MGTFEEWIVVLVLTWMTVLSYKVHVLTVRFDDISSRYQQSIEQNGIVTDQMMEELDSILNKKS
jgi:hypothetical protein